MRLGFSVKVYGRSGLAIRDAAHAHLSMRLAQVHDLLCYLAEKRIRMYRLDTALAPSSELGLSAGLRQLDDCAEQLAVLGDQARTGDVRLSFHPYASVVLNSPNEEQAADSATCLTLLSALLDALSLGRDSVIVLHVGGVYDDPVTSALRFVRRYEQVSEPVKRRLVLENDDRRYAYDAVRAIHARCGIPLVFDLLHHQVLNPTNEPWAQAMAHALSTWPPDVVPKIHYATPRTELRTVPGAGRLKSPSWTEHSDYVNPFAFVDFARQALSLSPFDIMLESKARDLALLQLRRDLTTFAPDVASAFS